MVGIIEEEKELEMTAKISLDLERKRNNDELSHHISKIDFGKYARISEVMPVEEYIDIDDRTESSIEITNNDIFNIVMHKEEIEEETAPLPPKITPIEASKHLESLMNYIQQSEEFTEDDYLMLDNLSTRLNEIREKKKVQANIENFMIDLVPSRIESIKI